MRFDGPATATGLAKRLGLNSGATSYHLRQLAEHGFIEEANGLGNKRERWWQARHDATRYDPAEMEGREAGGRAWRWSRPSCRQHIGMMQQALAQFPGQPPEWRKASNVSDYIMAMTAEEALALKERLTGILWEAVRTHRRRRVASRGKRNFMVMLHTFPFPGITDDTQRDGAT